MTELLALTVGEPAGIGPELLVRVAQRDFPAALVAIGDRRTLAEAARSLGTAIDLVDHVPDSRAPHRAGRLAVIDVPCAAAVIPGHLDSRNAPSVAAMLARAAEGAERREFDAIVTSPVQKSILNDAGIPFTGHTEFFADRIGRPVVMMLVADRLRIALQTTHLPLRAVADAITGDGLVRNLTILHRELIDRFGVTAPRIAVLGLNPHAGEGGHLGREEIDVIVPALDTLRASGMNLIGPMPADTALVPRYLDGFDAVLAMYHDQGLPVLKFAGFGHAVNVTLGLPYVRTSVDHGTALDLAGKGLADAGSLQAAIDLAYDLCRVRP